LSWIGAPHTQNFEIWKYLEKTQEKKKTIFDVFAKMLNGKILNGHALKDVFFLNFLQNWDILKFT
jgi:hypothetical protein